jgi:glycerol-3-phosphate dehydrogenase
VINATGAWCGKVAKLAGFDVEIQPDRGLLMAFNHRISDRIINRLRKPSDGDIFVPHGSITILGTTAAHVKDPADNLVLSEECLKLLDIGRKLFPNIDNYRILRGFCGTRPLYIPSGTTSVGRAATRNFTVIDHEAEGLKGMITVTGGKLTTYRLMAEKASDLVVQKFGNVIPCRTADEPFIEKVSPELKARAKKYLPSMGVALSIERQGAELEKIIDRIEVHPSESVLLCECELVTMAEFAAIAAENTTRNMNDVRRRTRMGMGTCQGNFCAFRGVGAITRAGLMTDAPPSAVLKSFIEERWNGIRPMLWGMQIKEVELSRGIYGSLLNVDGEAYTDE